jgi:hypothetical protein
MQKRILSAASKLPPPRNPTVSIETINRYFTEIAVREVRLPLGAPDWLKAYINGPVIKKQRDEYLNQYQNRGLKRRYEADPILYAKRERPISSFSLQVEHAFMMHRMNPARQYQRFVEVQRKLHLYPSYDDLVDPFRVEAVTAWRMGEAMLLLPVQWRDIWIIKRPARGLLALKHPEQAVVVDIWGNLHGWTNGDRLPTLAEHLGYGKAPKFKNNNPFDLRPENILPKQPKAAHRPMRCTTCWEQTTEEESEVIRGERGKRKRVCIACLRHSIKVWA